jgi:hypothetical protein
MRPSSITFDVRTVWLGTATKTMSDFGVLAQPVDATRLSESLLVTKCLVGVTAFGAASETENVSHVFPARWPAVARCTASWRRWFPRLPAGSPQRARLCGLASLKAGTHEATVARRAPLLRGNGFNLLDGVGTILRSRRLVLDQTCSDPTLARCNFAAHTCNLGFAGGDRVLKLVGRSLHARQRLLEFVRALRTDLVLTLARVTDGSSPN